MVGLRHAPAALLAVAVAMQLGARPVAANHAPPVVVGVDFLALLTGPSEACANQPAAFLTGVYETFDFDDGHRRYTSPMGLQSALLNIDGGGMTKTVQTGPMGLTRVDLTFPNPGRYDVEAWGFRTTAGANDRVSPRTVQIKVIACDFEIQQMSIWYHLPEGFKPWVGGLVDPVLLSPDLGGPPQQESAPLRTFAIGHFDCPLTFDVKNVNAAITVTLPAADTLHYEIGYTIGTATVTVTCSTPGGPIGSTSKPAPFQLDGIDGDVPVGPICVLTCIWTYTGPVVSRRAPHVLHQTSAVNGLTYVIIDRKP